MHGKGNARGVVSKPISAEFYGAPSTSQSLTILASSSITMMLAATIAPELGPSTGPQITMTVQGGIVQDVCRASRRLAWERLVRSLLHYVYLSHRSSSAGPNRSRSSISRTTRYTCGRLIRGIFFLPGLLQAQQEATAQQAEGHVTMPACPGAGLVFIHPHITLFRLEPRFNSPS